MVETVTFEGRTCPLCGETERVAASGGGKHTQWVTHGFMHSRCVAKAVRGADARDDEMVLIG